MKLFGVGTGSVARTFGGDSGPRVRLSVVLLTID